MSQAGQGSSQEGKGPGGCLSLQDEERRKDVFLIFIFYFLLSPWLSCFKGKVAYATFNSQKPMLCCGRQYLDGKTFHLTVLKRKFYVLIDTWTEFRMQISAGGKIFTITATPCLTLDHFLLNYKISY
jgi:hypothetical protein